GTVRRRLNEEWLQRLEQRRFSRFRGLLFQPANGLLEQRYRPFVVIQFLRAQGRPSLCRQPLLRLSRVERKKSDRAAPLERVLVTPGFRQKIIEARQQERTKLSLVPLHVGQKSFFEHLFEKSLGQVLGLMEIMTAPAHIRVERIPIPSAQVL